VGGAKHNAGLSYSAISDPDNTKNPFTTANGSFSQFCLKCHDGSPPAAAIGETTIVPYTVSFVNQNFRTNAGGWNKTAGYSYLNSAHYTNANMDSQTDAYGNKRKDCSNCHEWHGTAYKWLVNNPEDTSGTDGVCLRCHKPSGFTGAADVKTTLTALYRHPTLYVSGKHSNTEDYSSITTADRHAACYDCHDPHAAQVGNNPARAPFVQRAVYNVSGVNTPARGAGTSLAKGSYVWTNPAVYEWQVCYKCHSSYANLPTGKRDIAAEFNPANLSFHFVEGTNTRTHNVNTYRGVDRYGAAWTYNSKMYCGDCHGAAASAWNAEPSVQGPHGSANADILKGWWSTASGLSASQNLWNNRNTFLCFRCHNPNFYGGWGGTESNGSYFTDNGTANGHNSIVRKEHRVPCAACHGAKVHGKNRDHLISLSGDDSPSVSKNTGYTHRTNGQYAKNDCTTSGCASYYNIDTNSPTYQQSKDH
jgi:predicted CXXCH cytochrome family protein